jgi:hypothetical protein
MEWLFNPVAFWLFLIFVVLVHFLRGIHGELVKIGSQNQAAYEQISEIRGRLKRIQEVDAERHMPRKFDLYP